MEKSQKNNVSTVKDGTDYAKHLGYQGDRAVLVSNGLVISHQNQSWTEFCDALRAQQSHHSFDINALEHLPPSPSMDSATLH